MKIPLIPLHIITTRDLCGRIQKVITAKEEVIAKLEESQRLSAREVATLLGRCMRMEQILAKYGIQFDDRVVLKRRDPARE